MSLTVYHTAVLTSLSVISVPTVLGSLVLQKVYILLFQVTKWLIILFFLASGL